MPWSPLIYEKEMLVRIKTETASDETISVDKLHKIVMLETKLIGIKGITNTIKAFERLGYIKLGNDGRFNVNLTTIETRLFELDKKHLNPL
jgi:hypothetical protein